MKYIKGLIEKRGIDNMDVYDWGAVCEHCILKENNPDTTEDEYDIYSRIRFLAYQIYSELQEPIGEPLDIIKGKILKELE